MTDALPPFGDALTGPFWDGARHGELRMPRCTSCGRIEWYPRPFCLACNGELAWVPLSGRGQVHSQTVVRVPVLPGLEPPYVVAIIELEEGPRFLAAVEGPVGATAIGDRVEIAWRSRDPEPPLPVFRPVTD